MRWKIVLVNGGIVLVLALLSFFMLRVSLSDAVADPKVQKAKLIQAVESASARLSLDALAAERWLSLPARSEKLRSVFDAGTAAARGDAATAEANRLKEQSSAAAAFSGGSPSLVLIVDGDGVVVGRNGSELMRGDELGSVYPALVESLKQGTTGSGLWVNEKRHEQLLASYAPIASDKGTVVGALVVGTPLNDERLNRLLKFGAGQSLGLVVNQEKGPISVGGAEASGFSGPESKAAIAEAFSGSVSQPSGIADGRYFAAAPLEVFSSAVIVGSISVSSVLSVDSLLWPVIVVGFLGLALVVAGGFLLGSYISKPVAEIEEGLLMVINGQQDLRFDLEHEELGGLTSGINGLLNSILGTPGEEQQE